MELNQLEQEINNHDIDAISEIYEILDADGRGSVNTRKQYEEILKIFFRVLNK